MLFVFLFTQAQQDQSAVQITGTNKIAKSTTPKEVIDALNKTFPDAKSVEYYKPTKQTVENGWKINETDNLGGGRRG